ncbi:MAG: DNA mismatch repair protein MutS [Pediococcus acidilactici]|jgi:dsDNA-specific endonuclease/ATPase MutS2|nr:DNA mismatch repair protein MutS [Pediococcus acidilactici]
MFDQSLFKKLQFDRVKRGVIAKAVGDFSKEKLENMPIESNLASIRVKQQETKEARIIIESGQYIPLLGLKQINRLMNKIDKGVILTPAELIEFADFLRSNRMLKKFFEKNRYQTPTLYKYSQALSKFTTTEEHIYQKVDDYEVLDDASRDLRKARRQFKTIKDEIQDKLMKFLRSPKNKPMIQDVLIIEKQGSITVPIKASYKFKVPGTIVDQSSNGQTVYIELDLVAKLNEKRAFQKAVIESESYQILAELTGELSEQRTSILNAIDAVTMFDIIFARAKYSREYGGITPQINQAERINIIQGRHPFLVGAPVPLDFQLGKDYRGLIITGANAGGKTIVMKTVGLLTLMAMAGLQVPAQAGTELAVFDQLFVDIGDEQNIENQLSTFSAHMKNIAKIVQKAGRNTLVLLDELGSGTDPNEGAGLAIAILEDLYQKGALIVATTHYGEIKNFTKKHADFAPAAMKFDRETLTPKYVLQVGEVGNSQALWIAKKMRMPKALIQRADKYITNQAKYATEKIQFPKLAKTDQLPDKAKNELRYQKGDQVYLTELRKVGLVYEDHGDDTVAVFVEHGFQNVLRKRTRLKMAANKLYPVDYDLESLFTDFHQRKMRKDLERGSKKAQKQLDKMARARRNKN